ncbi:MAG: hypothetical protein CVV27_13810 [Candidatus Melainabacteria bacterium HGW-Melainabacteria-1]|nr:MAG: hypothetical protein CVV27_13810 [Candidatus Melainabacteria bacterium HGW-Melainabacteria-1]
MGPIRPAIFACFLTLSLASPVLAETAQHPTSEHLVDLSENHWCYGCVVKVVDKYDVLSGFQDHTFRGDWTVNRYELAAAVARAYSQIKLSHKLVLPSPADGKVRAIGVLPEHWAYHYVRKLAEENGLLDELFEAGSFHGDRVLTRKELAYAMSEFLSQMEKAMGRQLKVERRESQLAVDHDHSSVFQPHIELALNRYQFMNLHQDHTFRPNDPVTRYGLAAALCRVFELFEADQGQVANQ